MHNIYATVTDRGREKLAQSLVNDTKYPIRYFVVESSNNVLKPTASQSSLSESAYWGSVEGLTYNADGEGNVKLELPIREHKGGWWVREIGIYDIDKELFAVARGLEVYIPYLGLEAWEYPEAVLFNCYFKTANSGNVELALMHDVQPQIEHIQEVMLPKAASIEETIAGVKDNKFVTPKSLQAKKANSADIVDNTIIDNKFVTPYDIVKWFTGSGRIFDNDAQSNIIAVFPGGYKLVSQTATVYDVTDNGLVPPSIFNFTAGMFKQKPIILALIEKAGSASSTGCDVQEPLAISATQWRFRATTSFHTIQNVSATYLFFGK